MFCYVKVLCSHLTLTLSPPYLLLSPQVSRIYRLAKDSGLSEISRDEVAELLAADKLTPALRALWDAKGPEQTALKALMAAITARDMPSVVGVLAAHPGLLSGGVADVVSGELPLHAAARANHAGLVRLLVAGGAPLEAKNRGGRTALQVGGGRACGV